MESTFARDIVTLEKPDGAKVENIKASVNSKIIKIWDVSLKIETGDRIIRRRQNDAEDVFIVEDPGYRAKWGSIPASYNIVYRRADKPQATGQHPSVHIDARGALGNVIGNLAAGTINDSFKVWTNSAKAEQEDLSKAVAQLHELVKQLIASLESRQEGDPEEVAHDLEVLTREVTRDRPNKRIVSVTAENLIAAASNIAEFAGPLTDTVTRIMHLLGH